MLVKLLTAIAAAAFAFSTSAAYAASKVNVAYGNTGILNAPVWIAKDKGYFEKYGLDAELVQITGSRLTSALTSNSVQFISSTASSPFLADIAGGDPLLVATMLNIAPYDLVVTNKIKTLADFKGKRSGVTTTGAMDDTMLHYVLSKHGIDPEKDVDLVQGLGSDAERIGAITAGSIDFALVTTDYRNMYDAANVSIFFNIADEKLGDFVMSGGFTTATYAKAHPEVIEAYVKAIGAALASFHNDPDGTIAIISKYSQRPPADIKPGYQAYRDIMEKKPLVPREAVVTSLQTLAGANPAASKINPETVYDGSYAAKLDAQGFFDKLAQENK